LIQGLFKYGVYSLQQRDLAQPRDGPSLAQEFENSCDPAFRVLVEERVRYMAHQVRTTAVPGASVFVVCSALHCDGIAETLQPRAGMTMQEIDLARLAVRSVPVWPLFAFGYVIMPLGLAGYVACSAWESFVAPALEAE